MKKKSPTLTHYSKRLKKVRLARTLTIVATLLVSAVVVAANVLPQLTKSDAATATGSTNDILFGGVNQTSGTTAKSELIQRVYTATTSEATSAKALYTKFGIDQTAINNATFKWLYDSSYTGSKVTPNALVGPYLTWHSFGRTNNTGYTAYPVGSTTFYYKPLNNMLHNALPTLVGSTGTTRFVIILSCGNIVVETLPPVAAPNVSFTKQISSVKRGTTVTAAPLPSTFKLKVGDRVTYRLYGKNTGNLASGTLRLADIMPDGMEFTSADRQGGNAWPGTQVTGFVKEGLQTLSDGRKYLAWSFGSMAAGANGYTDFTATYKTAKPGVCNSAFWSAGAGQPLLGGTNTVCIATQPTAPLLSITKVAQAAPAQLKLHDQVTYKIVMDNTGDAAATKAVALDIIKKGVNSPTQKFVSLGAPKLTVISSGADIPVATNGYHAVKDAASQTTYANGNKYAYGYEVDSMPAGSRLTFTITMEAILYPQSCDFAIANYTGSGNAIAVDVTPDICIPVVDTTKPAIRVTKKAVAPAANSNVSRGQTITYDVIIENISAVAKTTPSTFTDIFLPINTVKNVKQISSAASFSGLKLKTTTDAGGLTWVIDSIPAGGKITIRLSGVVGNNAAEGSKFCNAATLKASTSNDIPTSYVCHNVTLIKQSKTVAYINRKDSTSKPANAGDELLYTLTTKNQATSIAAKYVVVDDVADVLAYATITDLGGAKLDGTKLVWPAKDIAAGGTITNKFKIKVKNPVPNTKPSRSNPSLYDYNIFNYYGNETNVKINKPIIDQIVDVATNLPSTGAAQYGLVVFFIGLSAYFLVRNKQLTSELAAATVEYQHQQSAGAATPAQNMVHPEPTDETPPQPPVAPPSA